MQPRPASSKAVDSDCGLRDADRRGCRVLGMLVSMMVYWKGALDSLLLL